MDSGDMSEIKEEAIQPDDVVVTESETTEATPQAEAIEEAEFYIEDEGDQQEEPKDDSGMTENQLKAAFKEEREKRKRKNAELDAAKKETEELKQRLERAEKLAIEAAMGKKPNPSDFLDAQDYHDALEEYNRKHQEYAPKAEQQEQAQANSYQLSDDQEFHAYKGREELRKHFKDFDEAEDSVFEWVGSQGLPAEQVKAGVIALTHLHDIDYAKAIYAINKLPALKDRLSKAPNDKAIAAVLKEAASKIKTRQAAKIDSKPEPTLSSTGSISVAQKALEKARKDYAENASIANFKKVVAARKQLN
jgi:hypothetical protein